MTLVSRIEIKPFDSFLPRAQNPHPPAPGSTPAVNFPVCVHRRIPLVRRDQIVNEGLWGAPIPLRYNDVTLDSGRPRRSRRNFSRRYARAPIGEHLFYSSLAQKIELLMHRFSAREDSVPIFNSGIAARGGHA